MSGPRIDWHLVRFPNLNWVFLKEHTQALQTYIVKIVLLEVSRLNYRQGPYYLNNIAVNNGLQFNI
jgi:hypothetical protein